MSYAVSGELAATSSAGSASSASGSIRLPKLGLTKFSGDVLKWQELSDIFTASIHDHPSLSDVQKLT